jgi:hypothetical protein
MWKVKHIYKIDIIQGDAKSPLVYDELRRCILLNMNGNPQAEEVFMNYVEVLTIVNEVTIKEINPEWEWKFDALLASAFFSLIGYEIHRYLVNKTKYVGIKLKDGRTFLCATNKKIFTKMEAAFNLSKFNL